MVVNPGRSTRGRLGASPRTATSTRAAPQPTRAAIAGIASWTPEHVVTSDEVERRITQASAAHGFVVEPGVVARRTGVHERRYRDAGVQASDMAVWASQAALADAGCDVADVDLLVFASSSQDLIEPATAHIVAAKLGARAVVFDVKNACNSFINAMQIGDSLIRTGQYRRVLVCTGEAPSESIRWEVRDWEQMKRSFAGYTFGDAGAAVVLESRDDGTGIHYCDFESASSYWKTCTLRAGGTMHPRDVDATYFDGDGTSLRDAFLDVGPRILVDAFRRTRTTFDDYDVVLFHQVTGPFLDVFLEVSGVPETKVVRTIDTLGNVASATLPLQLERARASGVVGPGSNVLWIGLGAGISLGVLTTRL